MTYIEAMDYIKRVGNFGSNYGLSRTLRILELLDNPQNKIKTIHVAGTNGKGSTTAMITEILKESGYKVGMYTSPFLEEFEERIQINGVNIPKDNLAKLIEKIQAAVNRVIEEGLNQPTEFEIITCLMFLYFYTEKVDIAVIEVGLGGRLDSTNVIIPEVSVITSISYDHVNLLGNTLSEIATEKGGIIKENIPVVIYPQKDEANDVLLKIAKEKRATVYNINSEDAGIIEINKNSGVQKIYIKSLDNERLKMNLSLLGQHQILNAALAIRTIEILNKSDSFNITLKNIIDALGKVRWNGRLEIMNKQPKIVIDGAHNIQGISQLCRNLDLYFEYENMNLIIGILADKDVEKMIKEIAPKAKNIYAVTPNSERAEIAEDLKNEIIKYNHNCKAYDNYEEAFLNALKETTNNDILVASGSLYMIGEMRGIIKSSVTKCN